MRDETDVRWSLPFLKYLRKSNKVEGRETASIERQDRVTDRVAERHVIDVARTYCDNHISAWAPTSAALRLRPDWEALKEALSTGEYGGILTFHGDRMMRHPTEAYALVTLAERMLPRAFLVITGNGEVFDLARAAVRSKIQRDALDAQDRVTRISEDVRADIQDRVLRGVAFGSGNRPFGWDSTKHDMTPLPGEADLIREVVQRYLSGETILGLVRDLNERGLTTAQGNAWTRGSLRRIFENPRHGGFVTYTDAMAETAQLVPIEKPARLNGGQWPILDRATFDALRAKLAAVPRGRPRGRRHLLTGLVVHDECNVPMVGAMRSGDTQPDGSARVEYRCQPEHGGCHASVTARFVDERVETRVLDWYEARAARGDLDVIADMAVTDAALDDAQQQVARLEENIGAFYMQRTADGWDADRIEATMAKHGMPAALDRARATLAGLRENAGDRMVVTTAAEARRVWSTAKKAGDMETMRAMVTSAVASIRVRSHVRGTSRKHFDPSRISVTLR